jgi:hypothetical protein
MKVLQYWRITRSHGVSVADWSESYPTRATKDTQRGDSLCLCSKHMKNRTSLMGDVNRVAFQLVCLPRLQWCFITQGIAYGCCATQLTHVTISSTLNSGFASSTKPLNTKLDNLKKELCVKLFDRLVFEHNSLLSGQSRHTKHEQ